MSKERKRPRGGEKDSEVPERKLPRDVPVSFEIDLLCVPSQEDESPSDGEVAELAAVVAEYEARLAAMSGAQRVEYDAKCRTEEEQANRAAENTERALEREQAELLERHRAIEAYRRAGVLGTQTEIGRPFGLSGVAVGRILDAHGLRERVDVERDGLRGPYTLHLPRGVRDGFAVHDAYVGREYWITATVTALLEPHAKR